MTPEYKAACTPAGQNTHNADLINVLGMTVGVKIAYDQTFGMFSYFETHLNPFQMGPPPPNSETQYLKKYF